MRKQTAAQKAHQKRFAAAAKECKHKRQGSFRSCIREKLKK